MEQYGSKQVGGSWSRMEFFVNRFQPGAIHLRIALRRDDIRMSQEFLDRPQIRAAGQQVRGE